MRDERSRINMDRESLARALGLDTEDVEMIESGAVKLSVGGLQAVLGSMGASLFTRLEVYDAHDDALHLDALADPEGYEKQLRAAKATCANAIALS